MAVQTSGTTRMTSVLVPKRATRGTVASTSCVPPYPCPQKKADSSPSRKCRAMRPQTASSPSSVPSEETCAKTRRPIPASTPKQTTAARPRESARAEAESTG